MLHRKGCSTRASGAGFIAGLLGLAILFGAMVGASEAALVTYQFQGAVSDISDPLFPTFNTGQTLSGQFTFNNLANQFGAGAYPNALTDVNLSIGPGSGSLTTGTNLIRINNSAPGAGADRFRLSGSINLLTPLGSFATSVFHIDLRDPTGAAFNSLALPSPGNLDLSNFATNRWRLVLAGGKVISGSLTSLQAVPLPATVLLFGAGLIALVGFGAGGLRNIRRASV